MAGRDRRKGSGKTRGAVGVSADDAELFRRVLHDVEPLPDKRRDADQTDADVEPAAPPPPRPTVNRPVQTTSAAPVRRPPDPPLRAGAPVGVDRRTADRLRRGKLPVEARLDLHGHTQDQAHAAVNGFITRNAAAGRRCVLIVTGKGSLSQGGGVLRRRLPDWLNMAPCRPLIVATAAAQPQDGGAGAMYVLLRRRRAGQSVV